MMLRKLSAILAVWVLSLTVAIAQPPAGDQPAPAAPPDQQGQVGQGGGQGGQQDQAGPARRGRPDMAQMQQMMMERTKTRLNATDDEWKAIEPLLQNVNKARMETMGRGAMGMGGRGRGPRGMGQGAPEGQGAPRPQVQSMPERAALEAAANDPEAKPDDIKAKLKAYREAMAKKEAALKEARNKLREVLSASQEAKLVLDGTLD